MKRYFKYLILAIFTAVLACAFAACDKGGEKQLSAPENVRIENKVLRWDSVENASGYVVYFENKEHETTKCRYDLSDLTEPQTYEIEVMAYSKGAYGNSPWVKVKYTIEDEKEETPTAALKYTLLEDKSGYEVARAYSDLNKGLEGRVVIPDYYKGLPVKAIADFAFAVKELLGAGQEHSSNTVTTSVRLPAYLEEIGEAAFSYCVALEEIVIPETVTTIGNNAFCECKLDKINLPKKLNRIESGTFIGNPFSEIEIPQRVNFIGMNAFARCSNLAKIAIPESVTVIPVWMFKECVNLKEVLLPSTVTKIGYGAFEGCSGLTKIEIPAMVTGIDGGAFSGCSELSDIKLPEKLQSLGKDAFKGTAWYENQPDGFVTIRGDILYGYKGEMAEGTDIDKLPSEIKYIADSAFYNCDKLASINLTGVKIWGTSTFYGCTSLKSVTLPSDITEIPESMFSNCKALETITIPEGVTKIGKGAFSFCSLLKTVFIPSTVTEISNSAFSSCLKLTEIYFKGTQAQWDEVIAQAKFNVIFHKDFINAAKYFYSESEPADDGNYWHYVDGEPVIWTKN